MSNKKREFLPYEQAKKVVHALGLKNQKEWHRWSRTKKRPPDIPSNPRVTYKDSGWNGLADWLGNKKGFLPYEQAKKVVNALGLKSQCDWNRWSRTKKRPPDIPSHPEIFYKNAGWNGINDWLGKNKRPVFLPYEEAKKVVNASGLKSWNDWYRWSRTERPPDIPSAPGITYKDSGWNGINDWIEDERWAENLM
tara:strand:+ start:66 stop:647 length:582 start_codon:yes stop_codon:yes gene_type:complete